MKKIFKFFAAALAIVAAASCAKELPNDDAIQTPEAEQELVHKVFSASLNVDPETKTTLHTDGVTVHWTEGDKIALIPVGKTNASHFSINPDSIDGTFADFEGQTYKSMTYIGKKPTINDGSDENIEVHIFDFDGDIYEKDLKIRFLKRIRDERKFDNLEDLKKQLEIDEKQIRELL